LYSSEIPLTDNVHAHGKVFSLNLSSYYISGKATVKASAQMRINRLK
jgi:hypothetical protein